MNLRIINKISNIQIVIYIEMATKVNSKILYIASDQQSEEQRGQKSQVAAQSVPNSKRYSYKFNGCKKLQNNLLSKGLFVQENPQIQYQLQKVKENPQKQFRSKQPMQNIENHENEYKLNYKNQNLLVKLQQKSQEKCHQVINSKEVSKTTTKTSSKVNRSKTLMFQFDSQDSQDSVVDQQDQPNIFNSVKLMEKNQSHNQNIEEGQLSILAENQPSNGQNKEKLRKTSLQYLTPNHMLSKIDKKQFLIGRTPLNFRLSCRITKKNQLSNFLYSQYDMYYKNYMVHLASCKKFFGNIGSNYRISTVQDDFTYLNNKVIGKIRSDVGNSLYNIYDDGYNPSKVKTGNADKLKIRQILATVKIKVRHGPRRMEVFILKPGVSFHELRGSNLDKQLNLETLYSFEENKDKISVYKSRQPEWIQSKQEYFLNFHGRIQEASIRNFILEDSLTKQEVLMFGKSSKGIYNLDISYPLSPQIGFGIAIPQLDREE